MNIKKIFVLLLMATNCSCGQTSEKKLDTESVQKMNDRPFTNHLINEGSPYLLMHAHNPVDWYPWGKEALEKAKKENKLIIISIGYAACHWCHVMEKESYSDTEVANLMNKYFVSIKVDREQRPDIDHIYMNAAELLNGSGGWPLNAIALPDGRPIYAGTYFSKSDWISLLTRIIAFVKQNPSKAEEQAKALTAGIRTSELISSPSEKAEFKIENLNTIFNHWEKSIDFVNGGFNRTPKFPMPISHEFLLYHYYLTRNEDALKAVTITLNKMASGGIYDQIGGGFARYSTDAYWKAPHFEKMLYDNAQLISLYAHAYQLTKDPLYKKIVYETAEFVKREMTSKEGGFYSSIDADSEGGEGKFYVWTRDDLVKALGKDAELLIKYFSITEKGNWERGNNILFKAVDDKTFASENKLSIEALNKIIDKARNELFEERSKRIHPAVDNKILTGWNGLMLKGYVDAYRAFGDQNFLDAALKNANFLLQHMKSADNQLFRNYMNGKSSVNAFLDDYAFSIDALIDLYQATFDEKWLQIANDLLSFTMEHFYDNKSGMFFYTSGNDASLITRDMEISDDVIPSSNSAMAKNLFMLGQYFDNNDYIKKAEKMIAAVKENVLQEGAFYANWDILLAWFANNPYEVAIVGEDDVSKRKEFDDHYLPNVFFTGGKNEGTLTLLQNKLVKGQTTIYVCRKKVCKLPVTDVSKAIQQILK